MFSNISGLPIAAVLYPLLPVVTIEYIPRHSQMSLRRQICPQLRSMDLDKDLGIVVGYRKSLINLIMIVHSPYLLFLPLEEKTFFDTFQSSLPSLTFKTTPEEGT